MSEVKKAAIPLPLPPLAPQYTTDDHAYFLIIAFPQIITNGLLNSNVITSFFYYSYLLLLFAY
jgi:hypothetical protein